MLALSRCTLTLRPGIRAGVMLFALAAAACATPQSSRDTLDSLLTAERAFALQSVREGMRAAFSAQFADDGVVFWPAPIRVRDAFATQSPPLNPTASTLDWTPFAGGVARSGELGFTTGPWLRTDNVGGAAPRHGVFFSIWRWDGARWQVVADAGAQTAAAVEFGVLVPGPRVGPGGEPDPSALLAVERTITSAYAYARHFTVDAMLASDATGVLRSEAIEKRWRGDDEPLRLSPAQAIVAQSGDLGYSYGAYAMGARKGYYLHLWTRDAKGAWRIAVATHQAEG